MPSYFDCTCFVCFHLVDGFVFVFPCVDIIMSAALCRLTMIERLASSTCRLEAVACLIDVCACDGCLRTRGVQNPCCACGGQQQQRRTQSSAAAPQMMYGRRTDSSYYVCRHGRNTDEWIWSTTMARRSRICGNIAFSLHCPTSFGCVSSSCQTPFVDRTLFLSALLQLGWKQQGIEVHQILH